MGTLYLVRHGQASFGAADYDNLSPLGQRQSVRLGEYFRQKGLTFDAVMTGTLRRQQQTYAGIREGMEASFTAGPSQGETAPPGSSAAHEVASVGAPLLWPGLNEFDSEAVIATVHPHKLQKPDTPELYRHHFRLLRDGLTQWMNGVVSPQGMPSYREFQHGVTSALDHIRQNFEGNVLIVSSGGPIATAIGHVLGTTPETTIELNMRIRNSAITEFAFNPKRHTLITFNTLPHLEHADHASWITHA
ncbi:histidine phosphatase family protein [Rhodoferax sp.]|uniref:histidine phosphatase family protein n=1 Tax=Rhodoferax sp. TaxID=50421 RepID=UPI00271689E1|nr:histidine phosphatase family protein [Rhodoferax sp.]MDO9195086.1 histidine phosphatase family protein [Rhodoferax sp.]